MDDPFANDMPKEAPAPPKKKSLFSSTVLAKVASPAEPVELFSRARELESRFLAEEERKRQKRLQKLERKRSSTSAEIKESTPPEEKRRRVSTHKQAGDGYSSDESQIHEPENSSRVRRQSSHSSPGSRRSQQGSEPQHLQASPSSLSARYSRDLNTRKQHSFSNTKSAACITLSDSEEESPTWATLPVRKPAQQAVNLLDSDDETFQPQVASNHIVEDENQFSDEEYPELVAAAEERARLKKEAASRTLKTSQEKNHTSQDGTAQGLDDVFETGSGPVEQDPVVEILVTSMMEGTNPVRARRRILQALKEVRLAWCDRQTINGQPAGPEFKEVIFLTYKGIRVFDFTTTVGLGFKVDSLGHLLDRDGIDSDGRIELEAWTDDAFDVYRKREAAKKQKELGLDDNVAEEPRSPPAKKIKLILKSKDLPEYKLQVKPTTTIERIIEVFKQANNLPDERYITLHFDGDKLEESDVVGDTELDDMDTVEVHIQ